ncbi:MAG: response regulator [Gemmatimonadales bacterium]|nr:response regulator [Gemmatimonadales bacterium]
MSDRNGVRILIADDDPAIVRLMSSALTRKGFPPPLEVSTGQAAVSSADQADILLLDYQLPDLTGMEVLEQLRHQPDPPSVVLVTAHGGEEVAAGALRLGAEDYLTKDAALVELLPEVVERVRRTRALRAALAEAERDLMLAARREAIGEMTVTLHHEINNPLMTAFAELSILLDDDQLSPRHRAGVEEIKAALERIRDIMRRAGDLQSAQAVEYVNGIAMMDLAALPEPAPANGLAVMWLESPPLARITELLLHRAGYTVERTESLAQLEHRAGTEDVAVVVVAGAALDDAHPLGGFHPAEGRRYRVVVLTPDDGARARGAGGDAVFTLPFDPVVFVRQLTTLGRSR